MYEQNSMLQTLLHVMQISFYFYFYFFDTPFWGQDRHRRAHLCGKKVHISGRGQHAQELNPGQLCDIQSSKSTEIWLSSIFPLLPSPSTLVLVKQTIDEYMLSVLLYVEKLFPHGSSAKLLYEISKLCLQRHRLYCLDGRN